MPSARCMELASMALTAQDGLPSPESAVAEETLDEPWQQDHAWQADTPRNCPWLSRGGGRLLQSGRRAKC